MHLGNGVVGARLPPRIGPARQDGVVPTRSCKKYYTSELLQSIQALIDATRCLAPLHSLTRHGNHLECACTHTRLPCEIPSLPSSFDNTLLKRGSPPRPAGDVTISPAPRLTASAHRYATAASEDNKKDQGNSRKRIPKRVLKSWNLKDASSC